MHRYVELDTSIYMDLEGKILTIDAMFLYYTRQFLFNTNSLI